MTQKKIIELTQEGYDDVVKELNELRTVERPRIIAALKDARAQGDLSENADYDAARADQARTEGRIQELEYIVDNHKIIEKSNDIISLGSDVKIHDCDMDEDDEYKIVGSTEVDLTNNKISNESPLGSALIGHKVGDTVTVKVSNDDSYDVKVLSIQ